MPRLQEWTFTLAAITLALILARPVFGRIERIWLTHRTTTPDKIVINWQTTDPGDSIVRYGPTSAYGRSGRTGDRSANGSAN